MMRYLPHTEEEIGEMLAVIGKASVDDLFTSIPEEARFKGALQVPEALDEATLMAHMKALEQQECAVPCKGAHDTHGEEVGPERGQSAMTKEERLQGQGNAGDHDGSGGPDDDGRKPCSCWMRTRSDNRHGHWHAGDDENGGCIWTRTR